jgi:hypothetical protein|tara:strand:+ start:287 stop:490 length:204 start_codon:yes stop_codon:yes gene_type:complete
MSDLINKRVIYPNGDGGVSVLVPVPDCGLTLEQIIAKDVPGNTYQVVDKAELPTDRTFRDAWEYKNE